jgi:hypothetical protein
LVIRRWLNIAFKISIPLIEKPAEKYVDVKIAKAAVVLISFVGAASSPEGISINFQGTRAPASLNLIRKENSGNKR